MVAAVLRTVGLGEDAFSPVSRDALAGISHQFHVINILSETGILMCEI
jgi:hypothetical protein